MAYVRIKGKTEVGYSGPTGSRPVTAVEGTTYLDETTGIEYIYGSAGWVANPAQSFPATNLYPVKIHTIAIAIVNAAAAQTDSITIDGVVCAFTSDATPTTTEISTGLRAAIAASPAAGKFVVTGTTNIVLTPAYAYSPEVTVSANLTDVQSVGALSMLGVKAHLGAGELHVGETSKWSDLITVTPIIGAAAFSANDFVGGKLAIAGAVRAPGAKGRLDTLDLVDTSKQNAPLDVHFFGADLAGTYADNAAEAVTAPDWLKWLGCISILATDYKTKANASLVSMAGIGMGIKAAAGTTIYALIVTTGTPTYGANPLQLTFGVGEGV